MKERRPAGSGGTGARRRPRFTAVRLAPAAGAACLVVLALGPSARTAPAPIPLIEKEFLFQPKDLTLPAGEIAFLVRNRGAIDHDLVLDAAGGKTVARLDSIEPGHDRRLAAKLPPGVYILYCSLPGHREAGMAGTLRVMTPATPRAPVPTPFFTEREGGAGGGGDSGGGGNSP